MSKFKLVSYIPTPDDEYTDAVAKVLIEGKYIVSMACKKLKDGGKFWTQASISYKHNGEKKFVPAFLFNNRLEDEELTDFVKDEVKRFATQPRVAQSDSIHYPHGLVQPQKPTSMDEVQKTEQLPF